VTIESTIHHPPLYRQGLRWREVFAYYLLFCIVKGVIPKINFANGE